MGRQPMTGMDDVERKPMTGMDDVERQAPHGDTEILAKKNKAARDSWNLCGAVIVGVVLTACMVVVFYLAGLDVHYYVAIDSVSGLDPTMTRELSFNLTLGRSWTGLAANSCIRPGTYVQVSYRGVPIAASEAQVERLCGRRGKPAEQHITARVTGRVPDSLAADMRRGTKPVFDITLHLPPDQYSLSGGKNLVSGCRDGRVGSPAVWCDDPKEEPKL